MSRAARTPVSGSGTGIRGFASTFSAFTFHLYPLLVERGLDTRSAVAAIACIGPAEVVGRIVIWVFAPHPSVRLIGSLAVALFPLAIAAIALLPSTFLGMAVVAVIYGAGNGINYRVRNGGA